MKLLKYKTSLKRAKLSPDIIRNGFRKSKIFPFNRYVIPEEKFHSDALARWNNSQAELKEPQAQVRESQAALEEPHADFVDPQASTSNGYTPQVSKSNLLDHIGHTSRYIIRNGFRKSGIFPFNRYVIPEEKFHPDALARWNNSQAELKEPQAQVGESQAALEEPHADFVEPQASKSNGYTPQVSKSNGYTPQVSKSNLLDHIGHTSRYIIRNGFRKSKIFPFNRYVIPEEKFHPDALARWNNSQAELKEPQAQVRESQAELKEPQAQVGESQAALEEPHADFVEPQASKSNGYTPQVSKSNLLDHIGHTSRYIIRNGFRKSKIFPFNRYVIPEEKFHPDALARWNNSQAELKEPQAQVGESQAALEEPHADFVEPQAQVGESQAALEEPHADFVEPQASKSNGYTPQVSKSNLLDHIGHTSRYIIRNGFRKSKIFPFNRYVIPEEKFHPDALARWNNSQAELKEPQAQVGESQAALEEPHADFVEPQAQVGESQAALEEPHADFVEPQASKSNGYTPQVSKSNGYTPQVSKSNLLDDIGHTSRYIIRNGFRKSGIFPFNRYVIPEEKFHPDALARWNNSQAELKEPQAQVGESQAALEEPHADFVEPQASKSNGYTPQVSKSNLLDHIGHTSRYIIRNGFRKSGIFPFNRYVIPEEKVHPDALARWNNSQAELKEPQAQVGESQAALEEPHADFVEPQASKSNGYTPQVSK
ncbi:hypothetical protein FQA39_LY02227 [Lamprigera yunnana]|nr:hypothetical protein FQA39_LY02227 [Lamprigera yunnana]